MRLSLILTLVLLVAGIGVPGAAWHSDMPVVHEETSKTTQGAWGVRIDLPETGDFIIEIEGDLADGVDRSGIGGVVFDKNQNAGSSSTVAFFNSPDRVVVHEETLADLPPIHHVGDTPGFEGQFFGLGSTQRGASPGSYYFGFWMGGFDNITLTVSSDVDAQVTTKRGTAHTHGDPAFTDGGTNVEAQAPGPAPLVSPTPGVKLMDDATLSIDVEHGLYGLFAAFGAEESCQVIAAGECIPLYVLGDQAATEAEELCRERTGEDCGAPRATLEEETATRISWQGPDSSGADDDWYNFRQENAGAYTFTVEHKSDAYAGPVVMDPETGIFIRDDEDQTLFVTADIGLP